jgi:hypothetical protein
VFSSSATLQVLLDGLTLASNGYFSRRGLRVGFLDFVEVFLRSLQIVDFKANMVEALP